MSNTSEKAANEQSTDAIIGYLAQGGSVASANNISPAVLEATYAMAHNHYINGQYAEAAGIFQYLCIYDQWASRHFLGLGSCQKMLHLYGQAVETYSLAHHLEPENPLPLIYKADCYRTLGQAAQAIETYTTAFTLKSKEKTHQKELNRAALILSTLKTRQNKVS